MVRRYRYPAQTLLIDGLRACFGLSITFGPLFFLAVSRPLAVVLLGLGFVFLWFGCQLFAQSMMSISPRADGLAISGLRNWSFAWRDLSTLKLAYYAPIRRQHEGWYRLTLIGTKGKLRFDSTLEGFHDLLQSAVTAAAQAKLEFDPSTRENLSAWTDQAKKTLLQRGGMTMG